MPKKYVPYCVGEYDPDEPTCNGKPKAKTAYHRKPCSWRNRCAAFQEYMRVSGDAYEDHIELISDEKTPGDGSYTGLPKRGRSAFIAWCDVLAGKYNIVNGVKTQKIKIQKIKKKKKAPLKRARRASVRRAREKARARNAVLNVLFEHFKIHFIENLVEYRFTPPRGVVRPGRFYVVDRRRTSKYVSVYCKVPGVLGVPVALIRFKPRTMTFDIELPIGTLDFDGVGREIMKRIHPRPIEDGRFKSVCIGMDKEGVALVAQTIAKMVKRGKIELPLPG